ncbi:MAG: hypothetical protein AAGI50_18135, partial [Pseudomonadota bacterium]
VHHLDTPMAELVTALRRSLSSGRMLDRSTRPPLAHLVRLAQMSDGLSRRAGRGHCRDATPVTIVLSIRFVSAFSVRAFETSMAPDLVDCRRADLITAADIRHRTTALVLSQV